MVFSRFIVISITSCSLFQDSKRCSPFLRLFVFVVVFVSLLASEILSNLYPYGKRQNDEEFGVDDSFGYYRSIMCLQIKVHPYGLRFFASRHYKLHVGIFFLILNPVKQYLECLTCIKWENEKMTLPPYVRFCRILSLTIIEIIFKLSELPSTRVFLYTS